MNRKVALVGGVGLGAALMYLFDPDRGSRRRALIRDKVESAANKTGDYAGKMSRDLRNRAYGVVSEAKSIFRIAPVTDEVLVNRVRSKLGHHSAQAIDVSAQDGSVTLRGSLAAKEVSDVLRAVQSVHGVKRVSNLLEVLADSESASGGAARTAQV